MAAVAGVGAGPGGECGSWQHPRLSAPATIDEALHSHLHETLQQTGSASGGPNGAAARLGPPRTTLIAKMDRLGINREQSSAVRAAASVRANFLDGSDR